MSSAIATRTRRRGRGRGRGRGMARGRRGGYKHTSLMGGTGNAMSQSIPNYGSASNWMLSQVGNGDMQYDNVFKNPANMQNNSNAIVGLQGQHAGSSYAKMRMGGQVTKSHPKGGRGRGRRRSRGRRGGCWGEVLKQAIVPLTLLGMQQKFGKRTQKKRGGKSEYK